MISFLYKLARFFNDISALFSGNYGKRMVNKSIGRHVVSKMWFK